MKPLNNLIVGCVGVKGSGKTHTLRRIIRFAPRVAVIDPTALLFDLVPNPCSKPEQVFEFLDWSRSQPSFAFGYCPEEPLGERVADIVPALLARGEMLVAFDEIPEICDCGKVPKRVRYLIRVGRHSGIDIAYTGQRFAEIPRTITSQTDIFILFRQSEPLDLDGIARRAGREVAERVKNLGPREFIVYDVRAQGEVPFDVAMFSFDSETRRFSGLTDRPEEEKENAAERAKAKSVGSR